MAYRRKRVNGRNAKARAPTIPVETIDRAIELLAEGMLAREVAAYLEIPFGAVRHYLGGRLPAAYVAWSKEKRAHA